MTIDFEKLKSIIAMCIRETEGRCTSTGVCIGVTEDGKQIQLKVEADDEDGDLMTVGGKWECVTDI
jgi:hypothetical protein